MKGKDPGFRILSHGRVRTPLPVTLTAASNQSPAPPYKAIRAEIHQNDDETQDKLDPG